MDQKHKIELVKKVRHETGLPINECNKILEEANWDVNNLPNLLEKYQHKLAQKKKDRETKEGKIFAEIHHDKLFVAILNCETDFVASNEKFNELGDLILTQLTEGQHDFNDLINEYIAKIGENITLGSCGSFKSNYFYLHRGQKLSAIHSNCHDEELNKQLCYHIVSMGEIYDTSSVQKFSEHPWFLNEKKTVKDILNEHKITIDNVIYLSLASNF
jgi:translation elongation factor EF-Ts